MEFGWGEELLRSDWVMGDEKKEEEENIYWRIAELRDDLKWVGVGWIEGSNVSRNEISK